MSILYATNYISGIIDLTIFIFIFLSTIDLTMNMRNYTIINTKCGGLGFHGN